MYQRIKWHRKSDGGRSVVIRDVATCTPSLAVIAKNGIYMYPSPLIPVASGPFPVVSRILWIHNFDPSDCFL
jgi:hypothetical protein